MLHAQFGYFGENRNADSVCVLAVNFPFKNDPKLVRRASKHDLDILEKTFGDRKCGFKLLESPCKNYLLDFLSDEQKLSKSFEISGAPSVFMIFVLSYGNGEGVIFTDHKGINNRYETFTTREVTEALKKLQRWKNSLKIVFFAVHSRNVDTLIYFSKLGLFSPVHHYQLDNGTGYSNFPQADNFVIISSTENRKNIEEGQHNNTSLIQKFCEILKNLVENISLMDLLTGLQNSVRETEVPQPPEVIYTSHESLTIYKSSAATRRIHHGDGLENKSVFKKELLFYPWVGSSGDPLRRKIALVYGEGQPAHQIEKALQERLGFETRKITRLTDCVTNKVHSEQAVVGCFLACFHAPLFVDRERRLCLKMKNQKAPICDLINLFATPRDPNWTKRPKIFFFINDPNQLDGDDRLCESASVRSTHNSGTFIYILSGKETANKLVEMLSLPALRNGSVTLQELVLRFMRQEESQNDRIFSKIVSSLPFLLDFPIWPSVFIPPTYNVKITAHLSKSQQNLITGKNIGTKMVSSASADFTFYQLQDEFEEQFLKQKTSRNYCVWILSSPPGSGKTLTIRKLECYATYKQSAKKVFVVNLAHHYQYIKAARDLKFEEILMKVDNLSLDVPALVKLRRIIIFYDGFDEICPELRDKVLPLIRSAADLQLPLVVATRPHEEMAILVALEDIPTMKIKVGPLGREKQTQLLMQISSESEAKCNIILEMFHETGFSDVLQNPLHLTLISNFVKAANCLSFFEIFKAIVDEKLRDAVKNKDKFGESHCKCESSIKIAMALSHKLAGHFLLGEPKFSFTEEKVAIINSTGIASISRPENLEFFHKSIAEFLVADLFLHDLKLKQTSNIPIFEAQSLQPCRFFIDSFFSQTNKGEQDLDSLVFYLKGNKNKLKIILETAINEGLVHIFKIALSVMMPFKNSPPPKEFECDVHQLLESACEKNEEIAIKILKTGLLRHLERMQRPELICRLVEKIASANLVGAYRELKRQCSDLEVILKRSKNVQALILAVKKGHLEIVQLLLESGVDTEIRDENANVALHLAAQNCKHEIVQQLLNKYADSDARDGENRSCLFYAAHSGCLETVEILVRENEELLRDKLKDGSTVLHYAVHNKDVAVFRFLVEKEAAEFEAVDLRGWNVFHSACAFGTLEHAEYLLHKWISTSKFDFFQDKEADVLRKFVNLRTDEGQTPLMLASYSSSVEICSFLAANVADIAAVDKNGNNALHYAVLGGKLDNLKYLSTVNSDLKIKDSTGFKKRTLLHQAVLNRRIEIVKFLIDAGAEVNARDADFNTPLHYSSQQDQTHQVHMDHFLSLPNEIAKPEALSAKLPAKICKLLRDKGALLSVKNSDGNTPLHCAAAFGMLDNVKCILHKDRGSVNEKNFAGRTPLHMACAKGHFAVVSILLLRYRANVNAKDRYKSTALTLAAQHSTVEILNFLIKNGANLKARDQDGENALHCACRGGKIENVKFFVGTNSFPVTKKNSRKITALEIASERGFDDIVEYLKSLPKPEDFPLFLQVISLWT